MGNRVPITEAQRKLSWAKYYDKPLAPVPEENPKYLEAPLPLEQVLQVHDRNRLFEPGYLPGEIGWAVLPDGTGYVANLVPMPGVTVEMFDWWFAWHGLDDLRYTIWDPEDHYSAVSCNQVQGRHPALSLKEKYWNTTHLIVEDLGGGPAELFANFRHPAEMGFNAQLIGTPACGTIVTANSGMRCMPNASGEMMCHFIREIPSGIELRTRFWMGWNIINGKAVKTLPDGEVTPEFKVRGLLAHNMKEFYNLADLLPRLYPEQKDNWA